jgi:glyoxylase-like metal-dependent hydrolase (beta-lactamase superfamily II)
VNTASINFAGDRPVRREIDVAWIHGSPSAEQNIDPAIQVFDYDEHTVILRQSMSIDREAPFLFLLFGNTRAVLIDTGATASAEVFPLRRVVDGLVQRWTAAHPRPGYGLLILHSHAHYDHIAGDGQFAGRPDTEIVGADLRSVRGVFRFRRKPPRRRARRPGWPGAGMPRHAGPPRHRGDLLRPVCRSPAHRRHRLSRPAVRQ